MISNDNASLLCGWMGDWDLWLGDVFDAGHFDSSGLLSAQEEFKKKDKVDSATSCANQ